MTPEKRPSICFVAPDLYPILVADGSIGSAGGAEVQQNFIARGLVARGYSVSVVTNDFGQADESEVDGVRVIKVNTPKSNLPFIRFFHPGITSLWAALKHANADIYYQRSAGWPTGVVGLYCRHYGRQFIYAAAHDLDMIKDRTHELFDYPLAWRARYLFQLGLRCASTIVVQNAVQHEACHYWHGRNAVRITSGYARLSALPSMNSGRYVLWVAALRNWKRPEVFVELARRLPKLCFHMVGGAAPGEEGKALYSRMEAEVRALPNVVFHGFLSLARADAQFDNALLFINTSDYEGFPNTFLQAWARAVPTISFVNCGARDDVGPVGVVVRDLDELTASVERFANDDAARSVEGVRCQHYFEQYHSVGTVIDHYEQLLADLMSRPT